MIDLVKELAPYYGELSITYYKNEIHLFRNEKGPLCDDSKPQTSDIGIIIYSQKAAPYLLRFLEDEKETFSHEFNCSKILTTTKFLQYIADVTQNNSTDLFYRRTIKNKFTSMTRFSGSQEMSLIYNHDKLIARYNCNNFQFNNLEDLI